MKFSMMSWYFNLWHVQSDKYGAKNTNDSKYMYLNVVTGLHTFQSTIYKLLHFYKDPK